MKRIIKNKRNLMVLILISMIAFALPVQQALFAEEAIPVLTRDEFIEAVLENNRTIDDLEDQKESMEDALDDLEDLAETLEEVYSLVMSYNSLGGIYRTTRSNDDYFRYLTLKINEASGILTPEEAEELEDLSIQLGDETDNIMTVPQYAEYAAYSKIFTAFGVGSSVSREEQYEYFIEPSRILPRNLESSIVFMGDGIETAKTSIRVGMTQMYNSLIQLEELKELLQLTYETSSTNYKFATLKYDNGLISEIEWEKAENEKETARLNVESMQRTIDSLKMNMNLQMQRDVVSEFAVEDAEIEMYELKEEDAYLTSALAKDAELIRLNRTLEDLEYEMYYEKVYLGTKSNEYQIDKEYEKLYNMQLESRENDIQVDIYEKHHQIELAKEALDMAYANLEDAKRSYRQIEINVEQGFVAVNTLTQMNTLIVNSVNAVADQLREYETAVTDLIDASYFAK